VPLRSLVSVAELASTMESLRGSRVVQLPEIERLWSRLTGESENKIPGALATILVPCLHSLQERASLLRVMAFQVADFKLDGSDPNLASTFEATILRLDVTLNVDEFPKRIAEVSGQVSVLQETIKVFKAICNRDDIESGDFTAMQDIVSQMTKAAMPMSFVPASALATDFITTLLCSTELLHQSWLLFLNQQLGRLPGSYTSRRVCASLCESASL
jgi:hypothetical protein